MTATAGRCRATNSWNTWPRARFEDPGWFVRLEGFGTESLLRENARLLAVSLILDWERYLLEEHRAALEATRLAIAVEATRLPPGLAGPATVN